MDMRRGITAPLQRHKASAGFLRPTEMQTFVRRRSGQQKAETDWVPTLLLSDETPPPLARPAETAAFFLALFDPFVFSYCMFDFPNILHRAGELSERDLLDSPGSMLMSPKSLFLQSTAHLRFGAERQQRLAFVLQSLLHWHDESERSPVSCARALGMQCPLLVPFLRGVCLCVETQHPFAPQAAYVFEELLTSGFVSSTLYLDGAYVDRSRTLAQLLQLAGREFGSESVLFTGLLLGEEHASPLETIVVGRLVAHTLAAADRRRLDWALKARGAVRQRLKPQHGWTLGPSPSLLSKAEQ